MTTQLMLIEDLRYLLSQYHQLFLMVAGEEEVLSAYYNTLEKFAVNNENPASTEVLARILDEIVSEDMSVIGKYERI